MLYEVDRAAVILRPTAKFLQWLQDNIDLDEGSIELTLKQIQANCRVFLIPQQESSEEAISYLGDDYLKLFELEVASWFEDSKRWPKMDWQSFLEYFDLEVLDEVYDLVEDDLVNNPVIV